MSNHELNQNQIQRNNFFSTRTPLKSIMAFAQTQSKTKFIRKIFNLVLLLSF